MNIFGQVGGKRLAGEPERVAPEWSVSARHLAANF